MADDIKQRVITEFIAQDKSSAAIKGIGASMNSLMSSAKTLGVLFITGAVAQGLKFFIAQGTESIRATRQLDNSLSGLVVNSKSASKSFQELAKQLQNVSGISDEEISKSMANLALKTNDAQAAFEGIQVAVDIAAQTGKTLEESTNLVAQAYQGQGRALRQLGIPLDDTTKGMKAIQDLQAKFGGDAKTFMPDVNTQWGILKEHINDIVEDLSKASQPAISGLLQAINKGFDTSSKTALTGLIADQKERIAALTQAHTKGAYTNEYYTTTLKQMNDQLKKYEEQLVQTTPKVIDLTETEEAFVLRMKNMDFSAEVATWTAEFQKNQNEIKKWADLSLNMAGIVGQAMGETAAGSKTAWAEAGRAMLISILDFAEKSLQAMAWVNGLFNPAGLAAAIAGTIAIEALKAGISMSDSGSTASASTSASVDTTSPTSTPSRGGAVSAAPTGGGGGGSVVINLINPTFLDRESKERTISDLLKTAQDMGYNITRNPALSMAGA